MDFKNTVLKCAKKMQHSPLKISELEDNVVISLDYNKFKVIVYYSIYEFEIGFNYYLIIKEKYINLIDVFLALGCREEDLPAFMMMSNESIMEKYLDMYFGLVDKYFEQMQDTKVIDKLCKSRFEN